MMTFCVSYPLQVAIADAKLKHNYDDYEYEAQ